VVDSSLSICRYSDNLIVAAAAIRAQQGRSGDVKVRCSDERYSW
jgi:hypothetical protein